MWFLLSTCVLLSVFWGDHPSMTVCVFTCTNGCERVSVWDKWLTHGFAGLRGRVHLVAFVAFTLIISFVVDANLTAGIWVFTFIYVCEEKHTAKTQGSKHKIMFCKKSKKYCRKSTCSLSSMTLILQIDFFWQRASTDRIRSWFERCECYHLLSY